MQDIWYPFYGQFEQLINEYLACNIWIKLDFQDFARKIEIQDPSQLVKKDNDSSDYSYTADITSTTIAKSFHSNSYSTRMWHSIP